MLTGEAFNLLNHRIITGVNNTHSQYSNASIGACPASTSATPTLQDCIAPNPATGSSAFGAASTTSNTLYGPRQMQFIAKLIF